jgi:hypothetical protein
MRRALGAALALALAGCAVFEADNRRTLNALDEHAAPRGAAARWALSPVALPVSLVAALADMAIVHPICSIDDAWHDTVDWLWTPRGESKFRRAVLLPLSALATPFVFTGDLAARVLFPVPPHGEEER